MLFIYKNIYIYFDKSKYNPVRTPTHKYNLYFLLLQAVSDLLLGVFCMPFTLLGQILKNFVFGLAMCKLIPYFQGELYSIIHDEDFASLAALY